MKKPRSFRKSSSMPRPRKGTRRRGQPSLEDDDLVASADVPTAKAHDPPHAPAGQPGAGEPMLPPVAASPTSPLHSPGFGAGAFSDTATASDAITDGLDSPMRSFGMLSPLAPSSDAPGPLGPKTPGSVRFENMWGGAPAADTNHRTQPTVESRAGRRQRSGRISRRALMGVLGNPSDLSSVDSSSEGDSSIDDSSHLDAMGPQEGRHHATSIVIGAGGAVVANRNAGGADVPEEDLAALVEPSPTGEGTQRGPQGRRGISINPTRSSELAPSRMPLLTPATAVSLFSDTTADFAMFT